MTTPEEARYTEADLREAFKAGWKARNASPGLKRVLKRNLGNAILAQIGGLKHGEHALVRDNRDYHHGIWLRSAFKKALSHD